MYNLEDIFALVQAGKKLEAIKRLRLMYTGLGLKGAHDMVQSIADGSLTREEAIEKLKNHTRLTQAVPENGNIIIEKSTKDKVIGWLAVIVLLILMFIIMYAVGTFNI
ncbi:hypothetical protein EAX61_05720 [Dokdonia sinensis]|uniref:Ribosomal protein L7/L12 C-terminal domain-containing protein n=1 Tax=Dokdonia sinensis TaxID=2479847 RepID=A0A3M0GIP1_9FLAO|nr:hypothetical protein [Dokdonia sinensis]RMB60979.1 hypothetical protein EAX61_05720 [Dokdonia sinensis]